VLAAASKKTASGATPLVREGVNFAVAPARARVGKSSDRRTAKRVVSERMDEAPGPARVPAIFRRIRHEASGEALGPKRSI
jgi:hypothetical protein